jgi:hypothetical protein
MGDKTSYRRLNAHIKPRDPMAHELENPLYHQRRVEGMQHKKKRRKHKIDMEDEDENYS